jgi:hypothetical protein
MNKAKRMFRIAVIAAITVSVLLCATSCIIVPVGDNYALHTEGDTITAIEIYDRTGAWQEEWYIGMISESEEPVAVIPEDRFGEFCDEFAKISDFRHRVIIVLAAIDPGFNLYGMVIKISYESGATEYISQTVQYYYNANGESKYTHNECHSDDEWNSLIDKFR